MRIFAAAALAVVAACAGCREGGPPVADRPSDITIAQALQETVAALHSIQSPAAQNGANTAIGFNPCTMQVTFLVTAGGTDNKSLVLNLGAPAGAPVSAGVQGSLGNTATASRENTVTLLFTTPACNPSGTLGTSRPDDVSLLQQQIGAARLNQYIKPLAGPFATGAGK
jgi:hypothetical protein